MTNANKPFSNCLQFCQFPAQFLQSEWFAKFGMIRFFLLTTWVRTCLSCEASYLTFSTLVEESPQAISHNLYVLLDTTYHQDDDTDCLLFAEDEEQYQFSRQLIPLMEWLMNYQSLIKFVKCWFGYGITEWQIHTLPLLYNGLKCGWINNNQDEKNCVL